MRNNYTKSLGLIPWQGEKQKLLKQVFQMHATSLTIRMNRICRNLEMAKDIVQEVFLKLCFFKFDELEKLVTDTKNMQMWLRRVAVNIYLDVKKNATFKTTDIVDFDSYSMNVILDYRSEYHYKYAEFKTDTFEEFETFLSTKSHSIQRTFELYFENYNCVQIGEQLGISENTIRTWIRRTIKEFKLKFIK